MPNMTVLRGLVNVLNTDLSEFIESADLYLTRLKPDQLWNDPIHMEISRQMARCARSRKELTDLARMIAE